MTTLAHRSGAVTGAPWNPDEEGAAYRRVTQDPAPGADEFDRTVSRKFLQLSRHVEQTPTGRRVPAPAAPGRTTYRMPDSASSPTECLDGWPARQDAETGAPPKEADPIRA